MLQFGTSGRRGDAVEPDATGDSTHWQNRQYIAPKSGFGYITRINYTDGVRVFFSKGDIIHVRPSGNANELRVYAVSDTPQRADAITTLAVAEPDGILRQLEKAALDL